MLFSFFILIILLVALIGARQVIAAHLQGITYLITGHRRAGLIIYSLLFLPGIIIHELSHFFMAGILGVRTGEITIFPSGQTESGQERLGSVKVAKADIIRGSLIGIAPLLIGSISIIAIVNWQLPIPSKFTGFTLLNLLWIYMIFAISNTMFVSEADRRSWPAMIVLLAIIGGLAVWAGVSQSIIVAIREPLSQGINILNNAFIVTLVIDVIVLAPLLLIEWVLGKILHRRLVVQ